MGENTQWVQDSEGRWRMPGYISPDAQSQQTLDPVVVIGERMQQGPSIPNPLHDFASYTYSWSLWWVGVSDMNRLMEQPDPLAASNFKLSDKSFVIAQDAGRHPDKRQPGTLKLNYNIQEVNIRTVLSGPTQRSSNMLTGSMTILEPFGISFVDSLIAASFDGKQFNDYIQQPLMLELEFHGYDETGLPVTNTKLQKYRKRFPIRILKMDINLNTKGAEYKINFAPFGHQAYDEQYSKMPMATTVVAGTIKEFFQKLEQNINQHFDNLVRDNKATYADTISFQIDQTFANSKIVYAAATPITRSNPASDLLTFDKNTWNIPKGTPILSVIDQIFAHSDFIKNQLNKLNTAQTTDAQQLLELQKSAFRAMKTSASTKYQGRKNSQIVENVFDSLSGLRPRSVTFNVQAYTSFKAEGPEVAKLPDPSPFVVKRYDYYYTGQNKDILDFKLSFNTTYYNGALVYTSTVAATSAVGSTEQARGQSGMGASGDQRSPVVNLMLNRALFTQWDPRFGLVASPTNEKYRMITSNKSVVGDISAHDSEAQKAKGAIMSLYSNIGGDMLALQMQIVGDPTLIKQDDWLYIPDYSAADTLTQAVASDRELASTNGKKTVEIDMAPQNFVEKYGHLRTDYGDLVVAVTLYNPLDIDLDYTNQGYAFPAPGTEYSASTFSGLYRIIQIDNKFSGGKFEQTINLARYINADYAKMAAGSVANRSGNLSPQTRSISDDYRQAGQVNEKGEGIY